MKKNSSGAAALCGVCSALAMVFMFSTAVMPVLMYTMPAAAGALLAVIVIEVNKRWAVSCYAAVSLLSLIIVPSKEATLLFILFLGYYPILKSQLEKIKNKPLAMACKIGVFTVSAVVYYQVLLRLFSDAELLEDTAEMGRWGLLILLAAAEAVFVVYDIALTRLISMYYNWFRKKILRR